MKTSQVFAVLVLLIPLSCNPALGQIPPIAILEVDVDNVVEYQNDISDPSKFAANPNVTSANQENFRNFGEVVILGDIVAVNGQPARGTFTARPVGIDASPVPNPGQAIADTRRISIRYQTFEILTSEGTPVGTIMVFGLNGGAAPPGPALGGMNLAIVGGTGAFLGARGQQGARRTSQTIPPREASITEDPANRRKNGGGRVRYILHVIPMFRPEIMIDTRGPAVRHSNDSLVTSSNPAVAGEILSVFATGLGPTRPGIDPGQPFPASPLAVINSPLEVRLNGRPVEVTAAAGSPGTMDRYEIRFRVPLDSIHGMATIQLIAAWIPGPEIKIAIQ